MGAIVLNRMFADAGLDARATSAGVSDEEHGRGIDARAQRALARRGYSVDRNHFAHRVSDDELREADLVLAMTSSHYSRLEQRAQTARIVLDTARPGECGENPATQQTTRLMMWRSFEPDLDPTVRRRELDVDDPWYGDASDFETTLDTLERCAEAIVDFVRRDAAARRDDA